MKTCFLIISFIAIFSSYLFGHGVKGKVFYGGIVVKGEYSTGEPMNYAKVTIIAPDKKIPFQIGRTDRNGCFCFSPDIKGKWKIIINDEMGHRLEFTTYVNKDQKVKLFQKDSNLIRKISKFVLSIFSIIGFFYLISFFISKQ